MGFDRTALNAGVFALAVTAAALLVSLFVRPLLEPNVFLPFVGAVAASAYFHGRLGVLLSTGLCSAAVLYFFLPPSISFSVPDEHALSRFGSFLTLSLAIGWLTAAWRESRGMFSATLSSINEGVAIIDRRGRVVYLNPAAVELTGWQAAEARRSNASEILRLQLDEDGGAVEDPLRKVLGEGVPVARGEQVALVTRNGARIPVEYAATPARDRRGRVRGGVLVFRDISGRRHLEEQISHSQKMEAVGRLAAGVAGDFNNVLTVITGYSELLRLELPAGQGLRHFADEILWAAERAATLTRQLLAFSRAAAIQPALLDLNGLVTGMEPMLRRLLGENIELIVLSGPGVGRVHADSGQMEQVIMNLATNAREAMPQGGKLVIESANVDLQDAESSRKVGVKPGEYVMLAISDTGVGMDAATRSRLFEPFFTTKEQGKGSGLGLSTVYGIIKQSDGHITVYSQPNCGTIFEIYLPRMVEAVPVSRKGAKPKGSETILLVDDEEGVLKLVHAILQSNGYNVIEAGNGASALAAFEKNAHKIDLVLTDVVMPQMNGFELGERLTAERPDIRILYMSGYRDSPIGAKPGAPPRPFLHKPFTPDVLLEKVREVLDARAPTP